MGVVPEASVKWAPARQVLRASVSATAFLQGCAIFTGFSPPQIFE